MNKTFAVNNIALCAPDCAKYGRLYRQYVIK